MSEVREVLGAARQAGLDVVAITDHNTLVNAIAAQAIAHEYGVTVVIGEEISTRQGHLLGLFLKNRVSPGSPLAETIGAVHAQGGIAIVAHPYDPVSFGVLNPWRGSMSEEDLLRLGFDAIETFNACLPTRRPNERAVELAGRTTAAIVAGSDAHSAATVGLATTLFTGRSAEDLRQSILLRQTTARGQRWPLRLYVDLFGKRELRYAGVAASYALALCGAAAMAAALAVRSGIVRAL